MFARLSWGIARGCILSIKPRRRRAAFAPRAMGISVFALIVLAFVAGTVGREIGLVLAGAILLTIWVYCLLLTLLLALLHSRRARRASIQTSPAEVEVGSFAEAFYSEGGAAASAPRIFQFPGILVRCRLLLETKDGRRIARDFSPKAPGPHPFEVGKRGAYFSARDEFALFDALGFFRFAFRLSPESEGGQESARLLAMPRPADEPPTASARSGDSSQKPESSLRRSDILIDHRPYVPGDDPRRINWKLYGHGGNLFVREGEREPPPHSNVAILVDAEYDPALYGKSEARAGVDLLCENALAAAVACAESGMDVLVGALDDARGAAGFSFGALSSDFAKALATPAARAMQEGEAPHDDAPAQADDSPEARALPPDRAVLVMALPRSRTETALDRFLRKAAQGSAGARVSPIDLVFIAHGDSSRSDDHAKRGSPRPTAPSPADSARALSPRESERFAAAELCAALFSRRPGVRARLVRM